MWFTTYAITFPPRFLLWFGSRFMSEIILCLFSGFQFLSATAVLSQVPWEYSPSRNNNAEKPRERYLFLIPGQIYWSQWLDKLERRERKRGRREKSAPGGRKDGRRRRAETQHQALWSQWSKPRDGKRSGVLGTCPPCEENLRMWSSFMVMGTWWDSSDPWLGLNYERSAILLAPGGLEHMVISLQS